MYKTSLLKTLDKAGMKNRLVGLILQKNNQEKERYIEVAERIAREKDYGLVIGYEKEWYNKFNEYIIGLSEKEQKLINELKERIYF